MESVSFIQSNTYKDAWRLFRKCSREHDEVAPRLAERFDELVRTDLLPPLNFLDVGVGNGVLTGRVLREASTFTSSLDRVDLVEPLDLIQKAENRVSDEAKQPNQVELRTFQERLREWYRQTGHRSEYDIILASHVVYYLDQGDFDRLTSLLSENGRLVIVVDPLDSLFGKCWEYASPDTYQSLEYFYDWCGYQIVSYTDKFVINISNSDQCVNEALIPMLTLLPVSRVSTNMIKTVRRKVDSFRRNQQYVSTPVEIIEISTE